MALKFRLKGLAETFVDTVRCPCCGNDGGDQGDGGFVTDASRVTLEGIIVVVTCEFCAHIFLPEGQRIGVINRHKLRSAVERDCLANGQPLYENREEVRLIVERQNAEKLSPLH